MSVRFWHLLHLRSIGAAVGNRNFPVFLNAFTAPTTKQERERTLPVTLYGEAKFQQANGDWKLLSVKVDKSQPSTEEIAALLRVPQRKGG